ncbi:hypothetical protein Poli38472_009608 [Pythium oligandrum]|uniref:Spore coat protein CotH n=1 Tax=Pythium oligandrum TaxID=41045 RepID=A0A8K1FFW3_PYTOL|nr:hypothetical protein Poli38472_009608 [Pythium oligandrum]|eukprot:TMW62115.1 hypothetical protein Poli38472_009608 [Pythium oligandrum]
MKTYVRFLAATVAALYLQQQEGIAAAPIGNDQLRCHEFPVVIVSAESGSFPDPTCNQLRFPAEDCLKEAVVSKIEVIDNKDGSPNCFEAPPTAEYRAKTNYRGQTSLFFPKHQLGVKFGENEAFLGLPEDMNFVLNGPYVDCTLLRNHLAHYLFRSTGRYSSRSRHVAMYFSDKPGTPPQYSGIYLLLEKMSYGTNRVGLAKMDGRCQGKELTGGWAWHNDPASYGDFSPNLVIDQYQNEFGMGERPVLAHPSGEDTSQVMRDYFVNTTTGFLPQYYRFLWNNMTNPDGLEQHIDLGSFADYILHTEMSLNVDAYRRSTYFFKDRDQPINAGPVWDLNLAYGNGARRNFKDWIYPQYTYWKRLLCNYKLTSLMIQRWKMMRSEGQPWSDSAITSFLDESAQPIRRQLSKCTGPWQTNVPQCASVDVLNCNGTYESRLDDLKSSVLGRARWMDEHITDLYKKLDGKTCSFVGEIPKYNCAANGDDDGCLKEPAKYYNAVQFPAIRKPFSGPECGAQMKSTMDNYQMTEQEKPSVDNCWLSSGVRAIYPNEKGVRDKTLTEFCGGYGTCQQGPGAKCECHHGVDLEPGSCRRVDAEYKSIKAAEAAKLNSPLRGMNTESKTTSNTNHAVLHVSVGLFVLGAIVLAVLKTQRRKQTPPPLHLSSPRAAGYGAIHTATSPRHV